MKNTFGLTVAWLLGSQTALAQDGQRPCSPQSGGAGIAFKRWAAPEAVMFGGRGLIIRGPEAIEQAVAGPAKWQWYPVAAGAAQSGDMGWTVGQAVIAAKGAEPSYSKYLTVWTRLSNGAIRFLTDGGNARPAASD